MNTEYADPAGWQRLLAEQSGLVTRAQIRSFGMSDDVLRAHLAARRWLRIHHGVFATFTGELTRPARLRAALLYAGDPAVLSHRTAAEEWGMLPVETAAPVHVTVPYRCRATSTSSVSVHRSRAFDFIAMGHDPPRTRRADTVIDLAASEVLPDLASKTVVAVAAGRVSVRQLMSAVERRRPWRHRKAIHEGIRLLADGVLSALEHRYAVAVEAAHQLPVAYRQTPVIVDGRTLWEDCSYAATGVPLIVRLDGRVDHSAPEIAFRDRRRDNAAELAGRPRLVYGWKDVDIDPCGVAAEVTSVLNREGWTGSTTPCPRCAPS